jgi:hypothetical protein
MHYACLVVGPDPDRQLEPFFAELKVSPYKDFLDQGGIDLMAEHFSLAPTDLQGLAARMPEWDEAEGGVEDGRLFRWSTANPDGRYDWYELGGRFSGYLHLKEPRRPSRWRGLLGAQAKERVDQALRSEIHEEPLLADPPAALLLDGNWYECPLTTDAEEVQRWNQRFASLFRGIPPDALLTVMDMHS